MTTVTHNANYLTLMALKNLLAEEKGKEARAKDIDLKFILLKRINNLETQVKALQSALTEASRTEKLNC